MLMLKNLKALSLKASTEQANEPAVVHASARYSNLLNACGVAGQHCRPDKGCGYGSMELCGNARCWRRGANIVDNRRP